MPYPSRNRKKERKLQNGNSTPVKISKPVEPAEFMEGPSLIAPQAQLGVNVEKMLSDLLSDNLKLRDIFPPMEPLGLIKDQAKKVFEEKHKAENKEKTRKEKPADKEKIENKQEVVALSEAGIRFYIQKYIPGDIEHFSCFKEATIRNDELRFPEVHFKQKEAAIRFLRALVKDKITSPRNLLRYGEQERFKKNWYVCIDGTEALYLAAHILRLRKAKAAKPIPLVPQYKSRSNSSLTFRAQSGKGSLPAGNSRPKATRKPN